MSHVITRVFHPVGHGAFYSERHDVDGQKFNIVYDCGSFGIKRGTKVVENAFRDNEIIDILFISHFDFDHISLIPALMNKNKRQIRKVVLPLLHGNTRLVLSGYYRCIMASNSLRRTSAEKSFQLLNDPQKWFREECGAREKVKLVFVRPDVESVADNDLEQRNRPDRAEEEFVSSQGGSIINSRSEKEAKQLSTLLTDWMFLPYNMDYFKRNSDLVTKLIGWLNQNNYSLQDLNNDQFYKWLFRNNGHRRQLAQIYKSLKGDINENSMLLFSGPSQKHYQCKVCVAHYPLHPPRGWLIVQPGCLYTGDFNLKQESLHASYGLYFNRIGTVQIPHHGSNRSFNLNNFHARGMICPVSHGAMFGHPDPTVLYKIMCAGGCPVLVNNCQSSELKEIIQL